MGKFTDILIKKMPTGVLKITRNISRKVKYYFEKHPERKPLDKIRFEVHLTDHCNLNCIGCGHFSPLVKERFADIKQFKNDIERMALIFNNEADHIYLLGGEPLLHPQLNEFLKISRQNFPQTKILLITNGLLLPKMDETFWESCKSNNIEISVTKYPISFDYDNLNQITEEKGANLTYFGDFHGAETLFYNIPLDLSGKLDKEKSFKQCYWANNCIQLVEGKLYTCISPAYYNFFAEYFNKENLSCEEDYIDIYTNEAQDILEFLSKPIPFCKYCDFSKFKFRKWEQSKKDISEWTL